jgi:uncharacterized membrane protein YhiD involved in acid resistance
MPEWLSTTFSAGDMVALDVLIVRLLMAAFYGGCVAAIYRMSHGRGRDDWSVFVATLVLLSVLIAMVSMVIGESAARAFSLVGALSIVRFRTVVEDTRDTAFVIFAVIVGMAAGTGLFLVPLVGIPLVAVAAVLLSTRGQTVPSEMPVGESSLVVRLGLGRDPQTQFEKLFDQHLAKHRLVQIETARQGAALDIAYRVQLRDPSTAASLVAALNQTEGVQSVELRME